MTADSNLVEVRHALDLERYRWDDMLESHEFYLSTEWLGYVDALHPDYRAYLLELDERGCAVGGMTLHQTDAFLSSFNRVDSRLSAALFQHRGEHLSGRSEAQLHEMLMPTLACGGRTIGRTRAPTAPELSEQDRRGVIGEMLQRAERVALQRGLKSLSALYVDEGDTGMRDALSDAGYLTFPSGIASCLTLTDEGYAEYLTRFSSHRRRRIRAERRAIASAGWTVQAQTLTRPLAEALAALQVQNLRKYGIHTTYEAALGGHELTMRQLPGRVEALVATDADGEIGGILTFFHWRDAIVTRQIGLDYDRIGRLPMYFELVFYRLIEEAEARGVHFIDMSIELHEVKASRGCRSSRKLGFVKCLDRASHDELARELRGVEDSISTV